MTKINLILMGPFSAAKSTYSVHNIKKTQLMLFRKIGVDFENHTKHVT